MWFDKLKDLGVNIHIIATGAGATIQNTLWEVPGSSAYLSGAQFPYSVDEQQEILGFRPINSCTKETVIDLASAAYMKAYKFGGKNPIGIGLTASVASEKEHRGEHRVYVCIITNDKIVSLYCPLNKGVGAHQRNLDEGICNDIVFFMLIDILKLSSSDNQISISSLYKDSSLLARDRFFQYPFFAANGERHAFITPRNYWALMPGAFNPPHQGHFGIAKEVEETYNKRVIFEITAEPPHKAKLSIQDLLKRAALLKGYDRVFTEQAPLYLDKAKKYPGYPLILGADALVRLLDPKWGIPTTQVLKQLEYSNNKLFVSGRTINDKFMTCQDIIFQLPVELRDIYNRLIFPVNGQWEVSSTELRNQAQLSG